ncbi:hypothetical protein FSP39_020413 [Pinctada imbricata]|uniref:Uncharacterized protein n=1 Tax=Pinctada imbricata TaxID=66713 RepID=A0AA89C8B1_PINIB|nr:hypothetical protein FSP39_020413 [Pinctada imbricata]
MVNISVDEQIEVTSGDVIGVYYDYPYRGGVPYTACDPTQHVGEYDNTRRSKFAWNYDYFAPHGEAHQFYDSSSCMILSVKAHILILP